MKALILLIFLFLVNVGLEARSVFYESSQSLAMGGSNPAVSDGYQALFSNPAALGLVTESKYSFINASLSQNNVYDEFNSIVSDLSSQNEVAQRSKNYNSLSKVMGENAWSDVAATMYYLGSTGFGTSLQYRETRLYSLYNPVSPVLSSKVDRDLMLTGSIARSFSQEQVLFKDRAVGWWGASFKFLNRNSADKSFDFEDFALLDTNAVKDTDLTGAAFDFDFSVLWQLNNAWNTTIGLLAGNILNSEISSSIGRLKRYYSAGISVKPLSGPQERNDRLLLAMSYHEDGSQRSRFAQLRMGARLKLSPNAAVLAGIRGGYLTGGLAFSYRDFIFEAATYAQELGRSAADREDRRYSASIRLEF